MSNTPERTRPSYREILGIGVLIGGVGLLTFTPVLYLLFSALQWQQANAMLERLFFPAFCLTVAAVGIAYQRIRARRALLEEEEFKE